MNIIEKRSMCQIIQLRISEMQIGNREFSFFRKDQIHFVWPSRLGSAGDGL